MNGIIVCACQGPYPKDALGRTLYPAGTFWDACKQVYQASGRAVPVFFSKQLGPDFATAKRIVDEAKALNAPLLSGSNMTCTYRGEDKALVGGGRYQHFLAAGASQFNKKDFEHFVPHTIDCLQSQTERRRGGPTGVAAVTCRTDAGMWTLYDAAGLPERALTALLGKIPLQAIQGIREATAAEAEAGIIVIEYRDGAKAVLLHLDGAADNARIRAWVAALPPGNQAPVVVSFECQKVSPFGHFTYQLKDIDRLMQTGVPPYPVGRQLVGAGILDAALRSRAAGGVRIETPELALSYTAADYVYDGKPMPAAFERQKGETRTKRATR